MSQVSLSIIMSAEIKISLAPRHYACHEMNLHLLKISEAADCRESSPVHGMTHQPSYQRVPATDKWDKWGKLRIQCLPPPHSPP